MATIPAVRTDEGLVVGYDSNMAAGKIHSEVHVAMKRLLSANDANTRGDRAMRESILGIMNELNRYVKKQFLMSGVTRASDYHAGPSRQSTDGSQRASN